jgi:hypothetical protein
MNSAGDDLAFRKKLLVARSSLYRLHIRHETRLLRGSLTWPRAARAAASTPAGRGAVFLLAAEALGTERVARWLTVVRRALVVARLAAAAMALLRARREGSEEGPDRPA